MAKAPVFKPAANPWAGMSARLKKVKKPKGKKGKGGAFGS
jgi:hypothetical protein